MKRTLAALALAGLVSFAACGGAEEEAVTDETLLEDTTTIAPVTPAPVVTDTAMPMDTTAVDTAVAPL